MMAAASGSIPSDYPGWVFRLNLPKYIANGSNNSNDSNNSNNSNSSNNSNNNNDASATSYPIDSSFPSDDNDEWDNFEGVQLLPKETRKNRKNPNGCEATAAARFGSSSLRYLAELCPHGVSVTEVSSNENCHGNDPTNVNRGSRGGGRNGSSDKNYYGRKY